MLSVFTRRDAASKVTLSDINICKRHIVVVLGEIATYY